MGTTVHGEHPVSKQERNVSLALFALAMVAFTIGTTEFVIMGLLPDVARDLQVSLSDAGILISGYALGIVIGAPSLTALTRRMPRKTLLLWLTAFFIAGNLLSALSNDYAVLMIARVLAALAQGAITGIAAVVASQLAPPHRQGNALAMVMIGTVIANVVGVPAGTYLGQWLGWHFPFWVITALSLVSFLAILQWVPKITNEWSPDVKTEFGVLARPRVILTHFMTVFSFGSVFVVFTYIAPLLQDVAGFNPNQTSLMLVLFGVGTIVGGLIGGKTADRALLPSLMIFQIGLLAILLLFALSFQNQAVAVAGLFLFGIAAFGIAPGLQVLIIREAKDAPGLASSFNIAAFNLGAAGGSFLGSLMVDSAFGPKSLFIISAVMIIVGLILSVVHYLLREKPQDASVAHDRVV